MRVVRLRFCARGVHKPCARPSSVFGHGVSSPCRAGMMNLQADSNTGKSRAPMDAVLLALLPGVMALSLCFGPGVLLNVLWITPAAVLAERIARQLEGKTPLSLHADRGTLLLSLLLAVSLPPACPWWLAVAAAGIAVVIGRRLGNGAGGTVFNPAMLAYAALLLCFPREMSRWPGPDGAAHTLPMGLMDAIRASLGLLPATTLDGFTMATPLEVLRQDTARTVEELRELQPQFGTLGGRGWEWANAAFLAGGAWLVHRKVIDWRAPLGLLLGLGVTALLNDDGSSASGGPVLFHLLGGGTMIAAFFILTEPGTSPRHPRVRLLGGILAGALMYLMRSSGTWPDGIAFAVLATNALTPFADRVLAPASTTLKGSATRVTGTRAAALRHAPDVLRVVMLFALLMLDWRGAANAGVQSPDQVTNALLVDMASIGYTQQQAFGVQDPALLGLPAARPAWRLRNDAGSAAVVLPLRAHEGYGGPIDMLLAVDERGRVLAVRVTAHSESPGFADPLDAPEHAWLRAFEGRGMTDARWALRKEGGDFDAFTGATITPRAIVAALRNGLQYVAEHRPELLGAPPSQDDGN